MTAVMRSAGRGRGCRRVRDLLGGDPPSGVCGGHGFFGPEERVTREPDSFELEVAGAGQRVRRGRLQAGGGSAVLLEAVEEASDGDRVVGYREGGRPLRPARPIRPLSRDCVSSWSPAPAGQ